MIKFVHVYDRKDEKGARDLVDGLLVKLSKISKHGSNVRYELSAAVNYENDLKDYCLVTRAGLSQKKISEGILVWIFLADSLIPKNVSGVPTSVDGALLEKGKVQATYKINTRLGPEEQIKPINLAPRVADLVLFYKQGLIVEDYKVLSAQ